MWRLSQVQLQGGRQGDGEMFLRSPSPAGEAQGPSGAA